MDDIIAAEFLDHLLDLCKTGKGEPRKLKECQFVDLMAKYHRVPRSPRWLEAFTAFVSSGSTLFDMHIPSGVKTTSPVLKIPARSWGTFPLFLRCFYWVRGSGEEYYLVVGEWRLNGFRRLRRKLKFYTRSRDISRLASNVLSTPQYYRLYAQGAKKKEGTDDWP